MLRSVGHAQEKNIFSFVRAKTGWLGGPSTDIFLDLYGMIEATYHELLKYIALNHRMVETHDLDVL